MGQVKLEIFNFNTANNTSTVVSSLTSGLFLILSKILVYSVCYLEVKKLERDNTHNTYNAFTLSQHPSHGLQRVQVLCNDCIVKSDS